MTNKLKKKKKQNKTRYKLDPKMMTLDYESNNAYPPTINWHPRNRDSTSVKREHCSYFEPN